jgi:hypothetical protein
MRPILLLVAVLLCGTAGCGDAGRTSEHTTVSSARPVLTTAASEEGPAASGPWLAWMQSAGINTTPPRSTTDVFVRKGNRPVRVNPRGTYALTGGITERSLVLQVTDGGRSRLAAYDLPTGRLRYLPSFVNDGSWLWRPDIDGHRVLYGAILPGRGEILAYEIRIADLETRRVHVLLHLDGHADYAAPGQLRGNWATWVSCPDNVCNVWRENLPKGGAESAPDPNPVSHSQLGPSVDRHGVVYFGRALASCGAAEIRRWEGRNSSLILRLPEDSAFQYSYLAKDDRTFYYDLVRCTRTARSDIYSLNIATAEMP